MNASSTRRPGRVRTSRAAGTALPAILAAATLAAVLAGCGGSDSSGQPAAGATAMPTAIQVMATAQRGDLTESVMGSATVKTVDGEDVVVATIDAQNAGSVAGGQTATVFFMRGGQGRMPQGAPSGMPVPQGGASGMPIPEGAPSGMPMPEGGASGMPAPQGSGMPVPQGGQGGFPGGPGQGDRGGTQGTVTAVEVNADGTAAATISVDELPSGVTTRSTGFARIAVEVLADDVILIPTAAIESSGSSASVQVLANGKTETRTISTGRQSGAQTEVVSGLSEGENVVYMQSFQVPGGGGQSGMPFPQQGSGSGGDQSGGSFQ